MGIRAYIYRSSLGKCAAGGLSDNFDVVVVMNAAGPFGPSDDEPRVKIALNSCGDPIIIPMADRPENTSGPMAGGTFVSTSDSRFGEAVRRISGNDFYGGIPFHDRYESGR